MDHQNGKDEDDSVLVIREEVFNYVDVIFGIISKSQRLKECISCHSYVKREQVFISESRHLREHLSNEECCAKNQLEDFWGLNKDQVEILWTIIKAINGIVAEEENSVEVVRVGQTLLLFYLAIEINTVRSRKERDVHWMDQDFEEHARNAELLKPSKDDEGQGNIAPEEFVRKRLRTILGIAVGTNSIELCPRLMVSKDVLDDLKIAICPRKDDSNLSDMAPFLESSPCASYNEVIEWLEGNLGLDTIYKKQLHNLQRELVITLKDTCQKSVRVVNCKHSVIYYLLPVEYVSISHCKHCTIVVGSAKLVLTSFCENVKVVVACKSKMIFNCHDCTFYLGVNECPCLLGDNRHAKLAPYNTHYSALTKHMKLFNILVEPNYWNLPKIYDSPTVGLTEPHATFSLLSPKDWNPMVVPLASHENAETSQNPFIIPQKYAESVDEKIVQVKALRQKIKTGNLEQAKQVELQNAIQLHFKDWLLSSGQMQEVYNLTSLEKG